MQRSEETSRRRSNERPNLREPASVLPTARTDSERPPDSPVALEEPLTTWLSLSFGIELG